MDEFDREEAARPQYQKLARKLNRRVHQIAKAPRNLRNTIYLAHQRLSQGWDQTSVWSLDTHLTKILGAQLTYMAEIAHGWHPSPEHPTFEDWTNQLHQHGAALSHYAVNFHDYRDTDRDDKATLANAQAALHWVADNLPALWD